MSRKDKKTVAVTLQLSLQTYSELLAVAGRCSRRHKANGGYSSHGELDVRGLLLMLAEDLIMTDSRPGSWEGANMQQVLDSHGYGSY